MTTGRRLRIVLSVIAIFLAFRLFSGFADLRRSGWLSENALEHAAVLLAVALLLLLLVTVVGVGVVLFDLPERREEIGDWFQMHILEGLKRDPDLSRLPLLPVVHVRRAGRSPLVRILGEVPSDVARHAVLEAIRETARRRGRDIEIDDRLTVDPGLVKRAA